MTTILPTLVVPKSRSFNVFNVLHHGTHEKQLSNLFAWLLTANDTHELGDRFVRWFLDEVNTSLQALGQPPVPSDRFMVSQEQNTRATRKGGDVADIVLQGQQTALVVENFHISDGHGHSYEGYYDFGVTLTAGRSIVVMLCDIEDRSRLRDGWQDAPVVLYANLARRLADYLRTDGDYSKDHAEQAAFLRQMNAHFLKGKLVDDAASLEFISVMCQTGEVNRYGNRNAEVAFGKYVRQEAELRFAESQALLNRIKRTLKRYLDAHLGHLNEALGEDFFDGTDIGLVGAYQWDVSLKRLGKRTVYVSFGPSAWTDNERNLYKTWETRVDDPNYAHLFIGYEVSRVLQQSSVTMEEVLEGLRPDDTRLLNEIVRAVRPD